MFALFLALFAYLTCSRHVDFVLEYHLDCESKGDAYNCTGKSHSMDIKTRITAGGHVHSEFHELKGSISIWDFDGIVTQEVASEIGTLSFGVHTTHHLHVLKYTGEAHRVFLSKQWINEAGVMHIIGGEGAFAGAVGGGAHTCRFDFSGKKYCIVHAVVEVP